MKDAKFSWVETHQKITKYISTKENTQQDLIDLLKSVGIGPFNDKSGSGEHDIELDEIDPFTFYCYIYKYGTKRRLKYLQDIATTLNIEKPSGDSGIPSAQAQKVWLFPYKYERNNNEVSRLWNLFNKELKGEITNQDFSDALLIRSTGKTKLTEALFYINPEKYLPINGPTKPYIKEVLGIDPKFNTYSEYLDILSEIREKISIPFYELSYEAWKWNDERKKVNYWVFQGNPRVFDFETALSQEILTDWTVSAHKDKIKVGDKVILWITGSKSGCYALAEVTSEPHSKTSSPDDHLWKGDDKSELKADIKITNNLVKNPILKSDIKSIEELNELKVGNQGTNFSATEDEYQTLLDLISSNNNSAYASVKNVLDSDLVNEYILFLRNYVNQSQLQPEDNRISFNVRPNKNRLVFIIGSRYALCIEKVKKKTEVSFISKDALTKDSGSFTNQKKEIEAYWNRITNISYFEDNIKEGFDIELARNNKNPFKRFTNKEFIEDIYQSKIIMGEKKNDTITSLNTILYGPPGTGKTYKLKNEFFDRFTDKGSSETEGEFFNTIIEKYTWWQIIGAVLLDLNNGSLNDIYNHKVILAKKEQVDNKDPNATIRGLLQSHTIDGCEFVKLEKRTYPQFIYKDSDSKWSVNEDEAKKEAPEIYELFNKIKSFKPHHTVTKKRYVFTTFHQSFSYEDFIEGIKPIVYEDEQNPERGKQVIYDIKPGLFKKIVKEANEDRNNDYAIFIDEINRGNIANIFGELITLIEDDKRIDTANYIPAKLPYSNEDFGVPPNLYIIGTMNTADRSVEALDTALRRRFSFVEMNPEPAKLSTEEFKCTGIDLEALLNAINARIEKLLDKDYCIGHSYFMTIKNRQSPTEEIKTIFQNKILPLLQEYFYGDWGKILLVIGKEFVETKKDSIKFLSTESYEDFEEYDEKPIYSFTDPSKWTLDSFKTIYE